MNFKMIAFLLSLPLVLISCDLISDKKADLDNLKTQDEKFSYVLGQQIGKQLSRDEIEVDSQIFAASLAEALEGKESRMEQQEMMEVMMAVQTAAMEKQQQAQMSPEDKKNAAENKEKGDEFLSKNAEKEGVKTTDSGLQYKVLEKGEGKSPSKSSRVRVHYKGTLIDGTEFDSSYARGKPAEFPLNGVISGWTEGLQLMKEGAKYKFFIPSDLAYGERDNPKIPANSALIFEVELLEILS